VAQGFFAEFIPKRMTFLAEFTLSEAEGLGLRGEGLGMTDREGG